MDALVENFFNLQILAEIYPLLLRGLLFTAALALVVVPLGIALGLAVAVLYSFRIRPLNALLIIYVDLFRAFPPLVLLILIFFGLPFLNVNLPSFLAAAVALVLNASSYYGEVFRAGIQSIPEGQWEAGRSTGLTRGQALTFIVLPQAVRNVIPPLATNTLELVKTTSIASVVAVPELLRSAEIAQGLVYNPTPLTAAALIYFLLLWPVVRLLSRLERNMLT